MTISLDVACQTTENSTSRVHISKELGTVISSSRELCVLELTSRLLSEMSHTHCDMNFRQAHVAPNSTTF